MLEEQNSVLSQIVDNILQGRYKGISQTSLTDGLAQALFTSMIEQAHLCNLLVAPPTLYYHHRSYQWTLQRKKGKVGDAREHSPKWI
jgi:hypothetical protein